MFWNKVLLNWQEPRFAQKYIAQHLRFKDYFKFWSKMALKWAVGTYVVFWILRWLSPRKTTSFFDLELLAIVLLVVGMISLLWLINLLSSKLSKPNVSLREKDILIISVEQTASFSYKELESFCFQKMNLDGTEYFVLNIKNWDSNESFIEIDPRISNESIIEILKSKNVRMKTPLLNKGAIS
jgi:hypothetical protein